MIAKTFFNFLAGLALITILSGCVMLTPAPAATPENSTVPPPTVEATPEPPPLPDGALEDEPVTVTPIPDVCDISYPTMCIPVGASDVLNCADITQRRFPVEGHDSQNFDANDNGIGCESR